MILPDEGLDGADGGEVLLGDLVHIVVLFQHLGKAREDDDYADDETEYDDGQRDGENHRKIGID